MKKKYHNKPHLYKEDAMAKPVCLICGEHQGNTFYCGKSVCTSCIDLIKANF